MKTTTEGVVPWGTISRSKAIFSLIFIFTNSFMHWFREIEQKTFVSEKGWNQGVFTA